MKSITKTTLTIVLTIFLLTGAMQGFAQKRGNGNIINETRDLPALSAIKFGGAFNVYYTQGSPQTVKVETDENLIDRIKTTVSGETLDIDAKNIMNPGRLNIYITTTDLYYVEISGAGKFENKETIKSNNFEINASGASQFKANLDIDELLTEASGASEIKLTGFAGKHELDISGAAKIKAQKLKTNITEVEASGASHAVIDAKHTMAISTSGAARVAYIEEPENLVMDNNDNLVIRDNQDKYLVYTENDGERIKVKTMGVEVYEDRDTTEIKIGRHRLVVDEWGNVKYNKKYKQKFNGHWAGIYLGINGYLNADGNMNFQEEYGYLDLVMNKSIFFSINFLEQNIRLTNNQKWGLLTGLGWEFHNYRFSNDVMITPDSSEIKGFYTQNISMRKSKLTVNYLTVPVLLEFQTNRYSKKNSFHFTTGVVAGVRVSSHTKRYFEEENKDYQLLDPVTRDVVYHATSPGNKKVKDWDDFHLNPFKVDATVRIGWGWINLFGNYSLTTLFKEGKGPELYPFSAGITLAGW